MQQQGEAYLGHSRSIKHNTMEQGNTLWENIEHGKTLPLQFNLRPAAQEVFHKVWFQSCVCVCVNTKLFTVLISEWLFPPLHLCLYPSKISI